MITSDMQRQYQLLKENGARMSFPMLFSGTPEYNDADFNKAFQGARLTPQDIVALTGGDNAGVSAGEWARLSPEVQQAILNDPGTFLRGQFGKTSSDSLPAEWKAYTTNGGGSGDLLSVGAEGGIQNYNNLKWIPGVGLAHPNSDYMQVNDQGADIAPAIMLALAGMVAGPAFAGALGGTTGGTYATVADAIAAGDFAAADAMGAAAFDAGGGISGMGSSFGSTGVGLDGLTFDGVPMEGDTGWSTMNTSVNDVAGNTWNPSLSASENLGIPQASFGAPAGSTPIYGTLPSGAEGITGYQLANGAIVSANDIALGVGGVGSSLIGGGGASSWLTDMFGKEGASLVKSIAPDLWKAVVGGFATDSQKKDFEALANKAAEMANPGAAFQRNTIWPALEEAIKTGNKPNAQTLAGLHQLMQSGADPNSDLRKQSANGFAAANDLVTNPMDNSGYSLADQAAQLYASLNNDPYSNPLISQTFQNAMEAAARKSAASGRLQGGNFLADSRNATTGAVVDASGKLGTQYGNAINSGMNMYDTQFKDALGLGTGAAGTANQNISAGAQGLGSLANLQQADSNYIAQLGNLAGFGKPENAAAAYAANQGAANKIDPWTTALYNGGTKIIDGLLTNVFKG